MRRDGSQLLSWPVRRDETSRSLQTACGQGILEAWYQCAGLSVSHILNGSLPLTEQNTILLCGDQCAAEKAAVDRCQSGLGNELTTMAAEVLLMQACDSCAVALVNLIYVGRCVEPDANGNAACGAAATVDCADNYIPAALGSCGVLSQDVHE